MVFLSTVHPGGATLDNEQSRLILFKTRRIGFASKEVVHA
jgi:hypothetical protein